MEMSDTTIVSFIKNDSSNESSTDEGIFKIPTYLAVLLSLFYCCVSLCSVIGNLMIIWIVIRSRRMRSVTNYFISNLALGDILIGAFSIPFEFQAALLQRWTLPWFMCSFCPTVQVISVNVSVFTLTAIALDRYRAVIYPLNARTTKLKIKFIIIFIWFIAIILAVPTTIAWNIEFVLDDENREKTLPQCLNTGLSPNILRHYYHTLVAVQYFIPLIIISFAYLRMGIYLHMDNDVFANSRVDATQVVRNKKRVIKMLFIVVALFGLCWLPLQLYNILQEIYPKINYYRYINMIWFGCHWLAMSNSCYNPLIYARYSEKFNYEFHKRFPLMCSHLPKIAKQSSDTSTYGHNGLQSRVSDNLGNSVIPKHTHTIIAEMAEFNTIANEI